MLKKICEIGCIVLVIGLLGTPAWSATSGVVATDQIVIAKGGNGPGDGTGNGPGDCAYMSTDNLLILAGNGPGDGDGNDGVGPGDGTGNGPGDCA